MSEMFAQFDGEPYALMHDFLLQYAEGNCLAGDLRQFEKFVMGSAENTRIYLEYVREGTLLEELAERESSAPAFLVAMDSLASRAAAPTSETEESNTAKQRSVRLSDREIVVRVRQRWGVSLALASLAIVVGLALFAMFRVADRAAPPIAQNPHGEQRGQFVASLTGDVECEWGDEAGALFRGAFLETGRVLDLRSGVAELTFRSGAKVLIESPTQICLHSNNAIQLDRGQIVATVPPVAMGFKVKTASVDIVDLGTEFGARVGERGDVDVEVFAGLVEIIPQAAAKQGRRVQTGESARWDTAKGQLVEIPRGSAQFLRDLDAAVTVLPPPQMRSVINVNWQGDGKADAQNFAGLGAAEDAPDRVFWNNFKTPGSVPENGYLRPFRNLRRSDSSQSHIGILFPDSVNSYTPGIENGLEIFGGHLNTSMDWEPDAIELIGLHPQTTYDLYLYSSRSDRPLTTYFSIRGAEHRIEGANNRTDAFEEGKNYVVYRGLTPDAAGRIRIQFWGDQGGVFSGLQIVEMAADQRAKTGE